MNENTPPPLPANTPPLRPAAAPPASARQRLGMKLITIVAAIVALQVPLWLIDSKREERAQRNAAVVGEITAAWGGPQRLTGPVLSVPARRANNPEEEVWLRLAPRELTIAGDLAPRELQRGIYRAQVYSAGLRLSGRFEWPEVWRGDDLQVDWSRAQVFCGVSRGSGLEVTEALDWAGQPVTLVGGTGNEVWPAGVRAAVPLTADETGWTFAFALGLNGSGALEFAPQAGTLRVTVHSTATSPSFSGARLPESRAVGVDGFEATWDVGPLESEVAGHWLGAVAADGQVEEQLKAAAFGVTLLPGVTDYRAIERAVTYGILFLVTVYAGCFLAEMLGGRSLNVINYLLVGAALCLFFLALLALSELTGFGLAYLLAALASTGLIVSYARAVLGGLKQAAAMAGLLGGIFGYLFLVLRLEDLSLVSGTALLFVLLGAVMYATRHLDFDDTVSLAELGEKRVAQS